MKKLLFLLFLSSTCSHAQNKWEATIQAFEQADRQTPSPKNPIVFVGSSSFAFWTDVNDYFLGKSILNRGFGGSDSTMRFTSLNASLLRTSLGKFFTCPTTFLSSGGRAFG